MPKKVTTESFISKAKKIHNDFYDYSLTNYNSSKEKIIIVCSVHGSFNQKPNCHLSGKGCPKCAGKIKLTTESFIEKAKEVHGDKYDYSKVNYTHSKNNIKIVCKEHGVFQQRAVNHLQGNGCNTCAIKYNEKTGWRVNDWQKAAQNSKNFDSFKVYIIKCWNEEEEFYKIGRTFTKVNKRFSANFYLPYNWKVVKIFKGTAQEVFNLEKQLQQHNIINQYIPLKCFSGSKECFKRVTYA